MIRNSTILFLTISVCSLAEGVRGQEHKVIVPPVILFRENSAIIEIDSAFYVDQGYGSGPGAVVVEVLKILCDNPSMMVEAAGYCDSLETRKEELSKQRAELVRGLLTKEGIDPRRIVAHGYSGKWPMIDDSIIARMSPNEMVIARRRNRRVEIKILSWDWKP